MKYIHYLPNTFRSLRRIHSRVGHCSLLCTGTPNFGLEALDGRWNSHPAFYSEELWQYFATEDPEVRWVFFRPYVVGYLPRTQRDRGRLTRLDLWTADSIIKLTEVGLDIQPRHMARD